MRFKERWVFSDVIYDHLRVQSFRISRQQAEQSSIESNYYPQGRTKKDTTLKSPGNSWAFCMSGRKKTRFFRRYTPVFPIMQDSNLRDIISQNSVFPVTMPVSCCCFFPNCAMEAGISCFHDSRFSEIATESADSVLYDSTFIEITDDGPSAWTERVRWLSGGNTRIRST